MKCPFLVEYKPVKPESDFQDLYNRRNTVEFKNHWHLAQLVKFRVDGEEVNCFEYFGRYIVLIDICGSRIPFYYSTGTNRPKGWYVCAGIDFKKQWIIKTKTDIMNFVGSNHAMEYINIILNEQELKVKEIEWDDEEKIDLYVRILNMQLGVLNKKLGQPDYQKLIFEFYLLANYKLAELSFYLVKLLDHVD